MVREYGSPTLFLALSCAEYDSLEIATYLRKVNNVSDNYPIGTLCTEEPMRKFSQKFHDFFNIVILKGQLLSKVVHYFYKEYQGRGAPHYHILLWIEGAPVAGKDDDDVVLQWIQYLPHPRGGQQSRAAQAGHQVSVPKVQQVLPGRE
jgi:hypothetical protein